MARATTPPDGDVLGRLVEAVERLAAEVAVMRQVIDEIRDDFAWGLDNDAFRARSAGPPPVVLKSMPLAPCAPDFGRHVNRHVATESPAPPAPRADVSAGAAPRPGELF
jgi:hypothetical protein